MSINYPNSPTNGQVFKIGNKTLVFNGSKWVPSTRNYYQYGTELTTTSSALNVDLSKSNLFSIDVTQQATLSFINPPTTGSYTFTIKLKNNNTIIQNGTTSSWDIRNMSSSAATFTLPVMDTNIISFAVSQDGTKSLFLGQTSDRVYQLDMNSSFPWDFSSSRCSYNNIFLAVGSANPLVGEGSPTDIYVDPTGSNLFICGTTLNTIYRFSLPTPWSLTGVSSTPVSSFGAPLQTNSIFFKPDGTVLYILDTANKLLYQYPLTGAAFDITQRGTAVTKPMTIETTINYFRFKPDGTKLYVFGQTNEFIYQYNLSTPWDISTVSYDGINGKVFTGSINAGGFVFKPEGDFVFTYDRTNARIQSNSLSAFTLSNTVTWPTNIVWQNNVIPDLPENQKTSLYEFTTVDGGATYHGKIIINNIE